METKATCQACGNQKVPDASRAGETLACEFCGGMMRIAPAERTDPFQKAAHADAPPTITQRLAMLLGLLNGLLCIAAAGIITFSGAVSSNDNARPDVVYLQGGLLAALAVALAVLGVLYMLCGANIRAKGAASAVVVLVLAPAHAIFAAINLSTFSAMLQGSANNRFIQNAVYFNTASLSLLAAFIAVAILSLVTHPSAPRVRAGRFFTLLAIYGYVLFALFLGAQGLLILGQRFASLQIPASLQNNLALHSAILLAGSTLMWLLGISVGRSPYFGPIAGLLLSGSLVAVVIWRGVIMVPALLARHDVGEYVALSSGLYVLLLLFCPAGLLIRGLFTRVARPDNEAETLPHRLAFEM